MEKTGICNNCGDDRDDLDEFNVCLDCQAEQEEDYDVAGLDGSSI